MPAQPEQAGQELAGLQTLPAAAQLGTALGPLDQREQHKQDLTGPTQPQRPQLHPTPEATTPSGAPLASAEAISPPSLTAPHFTAPRARAPGQERQPGAMGATGQPRGGVGQLQLFHQEASAAAHAGQPQPTGPAQQQQQQQQQPQHPHAQVQPSAPQGHAPQQPWAGGLAAGAPMATFSYPAPRMGAQPQAGRAARKRWKWHACRGTYLDWLASEPCPKCSCPVLVATTEPNLSLPPQSNLQGHGPTRLRLSLHGALQQQSLSACCQLHRSSRP
jgi:hypothetical protein